MSINGLGGTGRALGGALILIVNCFLGWFYIDQSPTYPIDTSDYDEDFVADYVHTFDLIESQEVVPIGTGVAK